MWQWGSNTVYGDFSSLLVSLLAGVHHHSDHNTYYYLLVVSVEIGFPGCLWLMTGRWTSMTTRKKFCLFIRLASCLVCEPHERPLKIRWSQCNRLCCSRCSGQACQWRHRTRQFPGENWRFSRSCGTHQKKSNLKETDGKLLLPVLFPRSTCVHTPLLQDSYLPTVACVIFCDFLAEVHFYCRQGATAFNSGIKKAVNTESVRRREKKPPKVTPVLEIEYVRFFSWIRLCALSLIWVQPDCWN